MALLRGRARGRVLGVLATAAVVAAAVVVPLGPAAATTGGKVAVTVSGPAGVALTVRLTGPATVEQAVTIPAGSVSKVVTLSVGKDGAYAVAGIRAFAPPPPAAQAVALSTAIWTATAVPTSVSVAGGKTVTATVTYAPARLRNLLVNGGAEATVPGSTPPLAASWVVTSGRPQSVPYGTAAAPPVNGLMIDSPGPSTATRGVRYFNGGLDKDSQNRPVGGATLTQTVSLAGWATKIAAGQVSYSFSGWLGGQGAVNDKAEVRLRFRDASNKVVREVALSGITNIKRANQTKLMFLSQAAVVPKTPLATKAEIEIKFIPSSSDGLITGYVDALAFGLMG